MVRAVMLLGLVATAVGQLAPPTIQRLNPTGLRFIIPNQAGMTLAAVHYSVNKPVPGVRAGDWNFDINWQTNGQWVNENRQVTVRPGDRVNYWIYIIKNGRGEQLLDQTWVVGGPDAERAARIRELNNRANDFQRLYATRDPERIYREMFLPDSTVLRPGRPAYRGRAIVDNYAEGFRNGLARLERGPVNRVSTLTETSAVETTNYRLYQQNGQLVDSGKSLIEWRKSGGKWYMFNVIWNSNQ